MIRITFGIIALNAQPFLEYNLRALYPFAHQIIVVEGAVRAAASLSSPDGHSDDGTREILERFRAEEDPLKKIELVFARDEGFSEGFWPEKDEMSQAYAKRATGDWLWQVDSDEFYKEEDMSAVFSLLESDPAISAISFPYREFFGSFESCITGEWHLHEHPLFHRLFRWEKGSRYITHRPPTVVDANGRDLREKKWISRPMNRGFPIYLYHYSYVFPKQAQQKVGYYSHVAWTTAFRNNERWLAESYWGLERPMFLGERGWPHLQWLERFQGEHPKSILALIDDIRKGKKLEASRPTADINKLLDSPLYWIQRVLAQLFLFAYWPLRKMWKSLRSRVGSRKSA